MPTPTPPRLIIAIFAGLVLATAIWLLFDH
jgi:hypothetical protein